MKKPTGFDLADVCECDECEEEEELTDVLDGHATDQERTYTPQEMADIFYDLCVRLKALGADSVSAFEMGVNFAPEKKATVKSPEKRPTERKPKALLPEGLPGDTAEDIERRKGYARIAGAMVEED